MKRIRVAALAITLYLIAIGSWIAVPPGRALPTGPVPVVVLGAAVVDDRPSAVFAARIAHGVRLALEGRAKPLVFTGGRAAGDRLSEAEVGRAVALSQGVAPKMVVIETRSRTTLQNLVEAGAALGPRRDRRIVLVSDPLHLRRASIMAGDLGWEVFTAPTPSSAFKSWRTKVPFLLREIYFLHHYWLFRQ